MQLLNATSRDDTHKYRGSSSLAFKYYYLRAPMSTYTPRTVHEVTSAVAYINIDTSTTTASMTGVDIL